MCGESQGDDDLPTWAKRAEQLEAKLLLIIDILHDPIRTTLP